MEKKKRNFLVVMIAVIILVVIILMFGCSNKDKSNPSAGKSTPTENISENEQSNNEISTSGTADSEQNQQDSEDDNGNAGNRTVTKTPTPVATKSAGAFENTSEPSNVASKVFTPTLVKDSGQSRAVTPTKYAAVSKSATGVTKTPTPTRTVSQSAGVTKVANKKPTVSPTKVPTKAPTATPTKALTSTPTPHVVEYITEITEVERTFTTANTISRDGTITLWHFMHDTAPDYPYITSKVSPYEPRVTAESIQGALDNGETMRGLFISSCRWIGESYGGKTTRITAMSPVELAIGAKYSDGTVKYYSEDECFVLEYLVCDVCGKQHK